MWWNSAPTPRDLGITDFIWFMNTATNPTTTSQPLPCKPDAYPDMIEAVNDAAINYATSASVRYNRAQASPIQMRYQ